MTKLLDPRKAVKQVQNISGTKGEGVDPSWTRVVYVLAHSLEGKCLSTLMTSWFCSLDTQSAETSMSHTYPACYYK